MMWYIQECDIRDTVLETGLDCFPTKSVYTGETCLINAAAYCDFISEPCQLLVCDCGIVGCAKGGWVSLRRMGDQVAMIPALASLNSDGAFELDNLAPPEYLIDHDRIGAVLSTTVYASITSAIPEFPEMDAIQPLTSREALTIIQMMAPLQVLGRYPSMPQLNHNLILAVTVGDTTVELKTVNAFIESAWANDVSLAADTSNHEYTPVEFHLDGPGLPAWSNFAKSEDGLAILLPPAPPLVLQKPLLQQELTGNDPGHRLRVTAGPNAGEVFPVGTRSMVVGRASICDVVIDDPYCNRRRFVIHWSEDSGTHVLETFRHINPLYLNGQHCDDEAGTRSLQHGDRIAIGESVFVYE
ncbi:MAG: FHA domain-containing protein [Fuerstiella sp.]|nr:FHA domain-containing protein [Fuerstiella sp.]